MADRVNIRYCGEILSENAVVRLFCRLEACNNLRVPHVFILRDENKLKSWMS